jgi:hypothetical protein
LRGKTAREPEAVAKEVRRWLDSSQVWGTVVGRST